MQRKKSKRAVSRPGRPARRSPVQPIEAKATVVSSERMALISARETLLVELRAKRDLLTAGISALEALG